MLFLVELDQVKSGGMLTPEAGRAFVEQIIFPTLARVEQLAAENCSKSRRELPQRFRWARPR